MPVMSKQGPTVEKCRDGAGVSVTAFIQLGGCFCITSCTPGQVSSPLLALGRGGCWWHREPGLLTCQSHICRALVVPPSVKGADGFCLAGESRQQ